jgi:membrane peptidoglycan carboxypeptidase
MSSSRPGAPRPKTRAGAKAARANREKTVKQRAKNAKGSRGKKWARWLGLTALVGFLLVVIAFFVAYVTIDAPKPNDLANAQASIIYYADGKTELDRISTVNREMVPLSKVPEDVQRSFLAAEDRNFYSNSGISPTGIARGAWETLRGGPTQSGSTITQQYVKNYFLTQDQTLSRKLKEIVISIKIGKQQPKDEILQNYINTIYYGRGAYGIQTASQAYFHKDVSKLNAEEGALLASVIRGPSYYDPGLGAQEKANAQARWTYVMDGLATKGWITQAERDKAKFPKVYPYVARKGSGGPTGFITDAVKRELKSKLKLTDQDIDRGGYKIVTTIDAKAQKAAVAAVKDRMPDGKGTSTLRVGLTAIKPGDGAVVAMYGGKDFAKEQFNTATQAKMQAGSTYKVFTLIAALQEGISTHTKFDGHSPQYFKEFADPSGKTEAERRGRVENFANEQFGNIDLRTATGHSVNTVFAPLNIKVGPDKTKDAAVAAGLPEKDQNANYANVFGTADESVIDMANAYATIAAQGQRVTPYFIRTVKGGPGDLSYKAKPAKKGVFDKDVMADTVDAMEQPIKNGTAGFAQNLGRPAAGKTGTTTDNKSAWFDGFTPQLATAVGIYSTGKNGEQLSMNSVPGVGELTGGTVPVRIWTDFMTAAMKGQKIVDFPKRAGIGDDKVFTPPPTTTSSSTTSTTTTTTTTPPTTTTTTPSSTSSSKSTGTGKPSPTITIPIGGGDSSSSSSSSS